jgi:hypothetical protein
MEIFILEDMNELEAAKVMLGGLLATAASGIPRNGASCRRSWPSLSAGSRKSSRPLFVECSSVVSEFRRFFDVSEQNWLFLRVFPLVQALR